MTEQEFINYLKRMAARAGSQRKVAHELGVSAAYFGDVISGKRAPGPKILEPLGLERRVVIEKTVSYRRRKQQEAE